MVFDNKIAKLFIIIAAVIASLGTIPYGYKFVHILKMNNQILSVGLGMVLAFSSGFANIALGAYSLLSVNLNHYVIKPFYLFVGCIVSSIPIGFICFFAYQDKLSFILNFIISFIVTSINVGIAYTAISNFANSINLNSIKEKSLSEVTVRTIGLMIGFIVSLTIYMASFHGLRSIFIANEWNDGLALLLTYFLGLITWMPHAALFSHAMQKAVGNFYHFLIKFSAQNNEIKLIEIITLVLAFFSGSAFAQIAIEFFDPHMNIPSIFKSTFAQYIIYHLIIPCAFISSVAVNYFALKTLFRLK